MYAIKNWMLRQKIISINEAIEFAEWLRTLKPLNKQRTQHPNNK